MIADGKRYANVKEKKKRELNKWLREAELKEEVENKNKNKS